MHSKSKLLLGLIFTLLTASSAMAEVTLPAIINSQMVMQHGVKAPIWGWADSGEKIGVSFAGQTKEATADGDGKWMVYLDPLEVAAKPHVMTIKGDNTITLDDVLVGEVWIASGQSNMEFSIGAIVEDEQKIVSAESGNKLLRMFCVAPKIQSALPLDDTAGYWSDCSYFIKQMEKGKIRTYDSHSAVGFFFGLKLQQELKIPVAVIDTSWGSTAIEVWISDKGYEMEGLEYREIQPKQEAEARIARDQLAQKISSWRETARTSLENGELVSANMKVPKSTVTNAIYNGMVAPLAPYAVKGTIWYQGEGNVTSNDYFKKLKALTGGWSKAFNVPKMPFYLVQMAPYNYGHKNAKKIGSQAIYESVVSAQYKAAKEIEGCDVITIPDTVFGNVKNVHPPYKKVAGDRLAALALKYDYGKDIVSTGPRFQKATLDGSSVRVSFDHIDEGLETSDGEAPSWFEVAAEGQEFVPAQVRIDGAQVLVSSPEVHAPQYVRMAWNNIAVQNLRDKNGWPVFSFNEEVDK